MKKISLFTFMLFVCMTAFSQEEESKPDKLRSKYFNIGYAESKLKQDGFDQLKCKWGASFSVGKTFYLHKKPIANFIRFGIDATWFDLTYANYKFSLDGGKENFHQAEAAMHVGPSVTFTPVNGLNICGYFRYAPTFSAIYSTANDNYNLGYATRFVGGASLYYKFLGVGFESRFGNSKIEPFTAFLYDGMEGTDRIKTKLTGFRVYLTFRY